VAGDSARNDNWVQRHAARRNTTNLLVFFYRLLDLDAMTHIGSIIIAELRANPDREFACFAV
jgi:hypothetical protein